MNNWKSAITVVFTILGMVIILVANYEIRAAVAAVARPALAFGAAAMLIGGTMLWILYWLNGYELWQSSRAERQKTKAQTRLIDAQAYKIKMETDEFVVTAPPGSAAYRVNRPRRLAEPLHLAPGAVNGADMIYSQEQKSRWFQYALLNAQVKSPKTIEYAPPLIEGPLPDLLPMVKDFERLLICGPSKAGKTTLLQHLIDYRQQRGQVIIVTPHADGTTPRDVTIGQGRDFDACAAVLDSLVWTMTERYARVGGGVCRYDEFQTVTVFIDEWKALTQWAKREKRKDIGDNLKSLLVEARKTRIFLAVVSHSKRVQALGVENEGDLRDGFLIVNLNYDQINHQHLNAIVEVAGQAEPIEARPPGPFAGYSAPREQFALPPPPDEELRAIIDYLRQNPNASDYEVCKAVFGVSKTGRVRNSSRYTDRVKEARETLKNNESVTNI